MRYGELNLRRLREVCDLDFAHFTYLRGMCSCCYGPQDFPTRYWRDGKIVDNPTYILFKNADNGKGVVTKNTEIDGTVYIMYKVNSEAQMRCILRELSVQLGTDYLIVAPESESQCITIMRQN